MALTKIRRPHTFSEVKGQEKVVAMLRANLTKGNIPFVSIFTGPFGTGKTTLARIVAKSLNCRDKGEDGSPCCQCESCKAIDADNSMDVLELDAASNNGVSDVQRLIEGIKYAPVKGKYKVYIIDEVHRLSPQAFDTLLKTFEEPPEYVRFILCTTEAHKVPATISSRGTRYSLEKISLQVIEDTLKDICEDSSISYNSDAIRMLAKDSDGHMRDALKNLEELMNLGEITQDSVLAFLGIGEDDDVFNTLSATAAGNIENALASVDSMLNKGGNLKKLIRQFIITLTDLLLYKRTKNLDIIFNTQSYKEWVFELCDRTELFTFELISDMLAKFNAVYEMVQRGGDEFALKAGLIQLVTEESLLSLLTKRVTALEQHISSLGNGVQLTTPVLAESSTLTIEPMNMVGEEPKEEEPPLTVLPPSGFVPVEGEDAIMAEVPFDTELPEIASDISLDGFTIGEAVSLDSLTENVTAVNEVTENSKGDKEVKVSADNSESSPNGAIDDNWFDAFARL